MVSRKDRSMTHEHGWRLTHEYGWVNFYKNGRLVAQISDEITDPRARHQFFTRVLERFVWS